MMSSGQLHAIMISMPFQGHINPFVNLALKLASKGILVTFVHLEHVHRKLSEAQPSNEPDFFYEARQSGLNIRYTTISDGLPREFNRDLHAFEYWTYLCFDFPPLVDEFVGKLITSYDPGMIHFLVIDTVYPWTTPIAQKYNLINVSFWTEPALVFSSLYHWDALKENGHVPCSDGDEEMEINCIPGIQSLNTRDLMSILKTGKGIRAEALALAFVHVRKADFILHNTVHELEFETMSVLNSYQPNYAIGPINFSKGLPTSTISKSLWSESDCTKWLESKSPSSVLYVSFGSVAQVSKQVIEEIAYGLLLSEVSFLWVIRTGTVKSSETDNILSDEYKEELKDKGLIIPWCDQIGVLSNSAIGGFLTHNGWNSTIESIWCGVPMLCYPITYDQPTNRKLVVDYWKVGINLCDRSSVNRKEVAKTIRDFMNGHCSNKLRHEASRVTHTVRKALEINGSSEKNFGQFIKDLKEKISNRQ